MSKVKSNKTSNYKSHIKLFLYDHIWILLSFLAFPIMFFLIYSLLYDLKLNDFPYYLFLYSLILLALFIWRFMVTWDIYQMLLTDTQNIDDYSISNPKCMQAKQFQLFLTKLKKLHKNTCRNMFEDKKNQKTMIYQWVHQIKTPLSVISLVSQSKLQSEEYLKINSSISQIQYNLDQIINMYKLDAIENDFVTEKINLENICRQSINELKSYFISNKVYPKLEISKEIYVYSDSKWLKMIIHQLLTNAVKYSTKNSSINIISNIKDQKILLKIIDYGCGIPQYEQSRIFDLFFVGEKVRQRGESSGIGLYIAKKIIDHLGHEISVYSKENEGSTFTILFEKK